MRLIFTQLLHCLMWCLKMGQREEGTTRNEKPASRLLKLFGVLFSGIGTSILMAYWNPFSQRGHPTSVVTPALQHPKFGWKTACESLEPNNNALTILRNLGDQALANAPVTRTVAMGALATLRPSVGGSDRLGSLPPYTHVLVICVTSDGRFAVIKQEQGSRGGVVEINALEAPS